MTATASYIPIASSDNPNFSFTNHLISNLPSSSSPRPTNSPHSYPLNHQVNSQALHYTIQEMKHTIRLSFPCILSYLLSFSNRLVVTLMAGHLGPNELGASSLAVMFSNVFGFSICFGITSALDTLASQAVTGANDPRQAGIYLQRAILINLVLVLPISILWIFAKPLLILAGQDLILAEMAGNFIQIMLISLIPNVIRDCVSRFLQAQGIMKAQFLVSVLILPLNITIQWLLVHSKYPVKIGFYGAAVGSVIVDILSLFGILLYTLYCNGMQCWTPWNFKQATAGWTQFLSLGIPGMIMICAEWWMFEIVALFAGLFGSTVLAAQSILLNTSSVCYMLFLGTSVASSARIGNLLGAKKSYCAKLCARGSIILALMFSLITTLTLSLFRQSWGSLFTSNQDVIQLVAQILPIGALFQFADGAVCVNGGILRGCGKQGVGAWLGLVTYYFLGLPLILVLSFWYRYRLLGIWSALALAQIILFLVQFSYIIYGIDWEFEVQLAQTRIEKVCPPELGNDLDENEEDFLI